MKPRRRGGIALAIAAALAAAVALAAQVLEPGDGTGYPPALAVA